MSTVRLVSLTGPVMSALLQRDLETASAAAGVALPPAFLDEERLWSLRVKQVTADPASAPWFVRAVVAEPDAVVGHAGFHGPPDSDDMVEIGYAILREHRRRGHARAAVGELLAYAREHGARTVRASVSPDNEPSLALVRSIGFVRCGEHWDDEDGPELVFERAP
ncbi:MAG: yjdG-like N-acetyltransferase [Frankiales bacterium]|nr:yjdG-like N-acetyltransferase [Frankiales bacterium]